MIPWFKPKFWGEEKRYVMDALESTWISDGEYIRKFESTFACALEANNSLTVSNGTTALYLSLLTIDVKPGDEVIIPGYTFAAPANMVMACGATPVFVDIDRDTWLINPNLIEEKISKKTKAIIPVHIYGNVCNMDAIRSIADKHGLYVIEDVAEAAFSKYKGKYAGTLGNFGCFSFQATKTITMGEGGAVIFEDKDFEHKARIIRNHGMTAKNPYWHLLVGHNFRLTNMQAALGYAQLEHIDMIIDEKTRVYNRYKNNLMDINCIEFQKINNDVEPVMWAFAIYLNKNIIAISRDELREILLKQGIETRGGFYSFDKMSVYPSDSLPVSSAISNNLISLPSFASLSNDEIDFICETLIKFGIKSYV